MSSEIKIIVFIIVSAGLAYLTRCSLRSIYHHGIYRLLSWMALLALVLLNIDYWVRDPLGLTQLLSWFLLFISLVAVVSGYLSLQSARHEGGRKDDTLLEIEKTTELVTTGVYRYIRHPIYSSFLYGSWGVFLKHISYTGAILVILTTLFAAIAAKKEEIENINYFGQVYCEYMNRTRMFIPFLY